MGWSKLRKLNDQLVWLLQVWATSEIRKIGLEYPSITPTFKVAHSPGYGTKKGTGPNYEPDEAAKRVSKAMDSICPRDKALLEAKYIEGMQDRVIALICRKKTGKIRWMMEIAHRAIAKEMNIDPYQKRR